MSILRIRNLALLLLLPSMAANGQDDEETVGLLDQTVPVAEAAPEEDTTLEPEGGTAPTEADVLQEFERFRELLAEQNFDEADISAKRVVQMSIEIYGPQSRETAKALSNLAIVQHNNQQFDAAIQNFTSAIEILEIVEDRLNEELVNPLKGLGAAQLGAGRPGRAAQSFDRARHITHVNEGPHNIEQIEILESLAEANVRLGDVKTARNILDRIHMLNVRHFENDKLGLLPSLMRRASWQHRAGYYNDERATYRRAIRLIEESAGKKDPRLVDPLVRLGNSFYYFQPLSDNVARPVANSGQAYLKRAERIAEDSDELSWLEKATVKLALADYYAVAEEYNRARRHYKEVWDWLSTDEDRAAMRDELMGDPRPIWEEPLPVRSNAAGASRRPNDLATGVITINYTVTPRGRVRVTGSIVDPPEFTDMERMVHREIRRRVYRPAMVDGVPVESGNQVFRHEFQYRRSEVEELPEQGQAEEQATASES
jgi:tetratricopeptide (TPR) repeat protein